MFCNLGLGFLNSCVNDDCLGFRDQLLAYTTSNYTWAFYFLDPYGPSGIPHDFVQPIVQKHRHDVMINFPYQDLHKKSGMALKEDLEPRYQQLVDYWTEVYNGESWKNVEAEIQIRRNLRDALWDMPFDEIEDDAVLTDEQASNFKERELVNRYRKILKDMDTGLSVKLVDLQFPDRDRTMFYLFLTTHDPTGALALNKILDDAKYLEYELRYRLWFAKKTAPPPGQLTLDLLPVEPTPAPKQSTPQRPTPEQIAEEILGRLSGKKLNRRQVYQTFADDLYFTTEIDKALKLLKKNGEAKFTGDLKHETVIEFLNP